MTILIIGGVLLCIIAGVVIYDTNRFVIKRYELQDGRLTGDYRFVMLSDLHGKSYGKDNIRLLKAIEDCKPDAVYIAGDMITAKPEADFSTAVKLIRDLSDQYPVYYGSGNHEYRMEIYPQKFENMSRQFEEAIRHPNLIRLKNNRYFIPGKNIQVLGVEIDREYYKKLHAPQMTAAYLKEKLGETDSSCYSILIAHNPAYFPVYAEYGADLVLSGHVHGGIARLPLLGGVISPALRLFPKYDGGLFKKDGKVMILGRGLGTHTLPIRFLNPGELVEVTISSSPLANKPKM
ncbi:MAG: metallophosphoesterase [Lachnospiraceae bacterium]|nr:metallophosphoesterase [Lachnospiraceae bacterium]